MSDPNRSSRVSAALPDVTITIDYNTALMVSKTKLNVVFVHETPVTASGQDVTARNNAILRLSQAFHYGSFHLHTFGCDAPWTNELKRDGVGTADPQNQWSWTLLDQYHDFIVECSLEPILYAYGYPGWQRMDGGSFDVAGDDPLALGRTWQNIDGGHTYPVTDLHESDFIDILEACAIRYPDVKIFTFLHENKGMFVNSSGAMVTTEHNAHGHVDEMNYTKANRIVNAAKTMLAGLSAAQRPNGSAVCGPYLRWEGSGARTLGLPNAWYNVVPLTARDLENVDAYLANVTPTANCEVWVCGDRNILRTNDEPPDIVSERERFELMQYFGKVWTDIKARAGYSNHKLFSTESYVFNNGDERIIFDNQMQAAGCASILYHEILAGVHISTRWKPFAVSSDAWPEHRIITPTDVAGGGQAMPQYWPYRYVKDHFSDGVTLYTTTSTDERTRILASDTATMLINEEPRRKRVSVDGTGYILTPCEVKLIER